MLTTQPSVLETLAPATNTSADDWEDLDGPDSGVGVDSWYRPTLRHRAAMSWRHAPRLTGRHDFVGCAM